MDSKYESLPGIARNEPDAYETTDVDTIQGSDQQLYEDDSSVVHRIQISQKEAFDSFNKFEINSRNADFSDSIGNQFKRGFQIDKDFYEFNNQTDETLIEKFNRLQKEFYDLKNEIKQSELNGNKTSESNEDQNLSKQVESLQKELNTLHLETVGAKFDGTKLDSKVKKQLLIDYLNDSKKSLFREETTTTTNSNNKLSNNKIESANEKSIVFKLFNDIDGSNISKLAKISEIDQRISRLESIIGANQGNKVISTLCTNIDNKTILGIVENLDTKINLIEPQSIDLIESKLSWIIQKVQQINEKKNLIEDNEKMNKIFELYAMTTKWKDVLATLPNLTSRLNALSDLHHEAFQFSSALKRLDFEQQTIKDNLEKNVDLLRQLKTNLNGNIDAINKNLDSLNHKISEIKTL